MPILNEALSATSIEKLLAGQEGSTTFAVRIWQGQGLLGGTMLGLSPERGETPHAAFTGAGVVEVVAAEAGVLYALCCSL